MDFYTSIAHYYDRIFPLEDNQIRFVENRLPEEKNSFLDVGCATGNLVRALSGHFIISMGIDLDDELIGIAKTGKYKQNVFFIKKNMLDIDQISEANAFSLITCLGNTIPHLDGFSDILSFHKKVFSCLEENGVYIMQIINFDRILDRRINMLPTIETDRIKFERTYSLLKPDNKIDFMTRLTDKTGSRIITNEIGLLPIRKKELSEIFRESGFDAVELYGSYDGTLYADDSYLLIAVCKK